MKSPVSRTGLDWFRWPKQDEAGQPNGRPTPVAARFAQLNGLPLDD